MEHTKPLPEEPYLGNVPRRSTLELLFDALGCGKRIGRALAAFVESQNEEIQRLEQHVTNLARENNSLRGQHRSNEVADEKEFHTRLASAMETERTAYKASIRSFQQEVAEYKAEADRLRARHVVTLSVPPGPDTISRGLTLSKEQWGRLIDTLWATGNDEAVRQLELNDVVSSTVKTIPPFPVSTSDELRLFRPMLHDRCGCLAYQDYSRSPFVFSCTKCGSIEESELRPQNKALGEIGKMQAGSPSLEDGKR